MFSDQDDERADTARVRLPDAWEDPGPLTNPTPSKRPVREELSSPARLEICENDRFRGTDAGPVMRTSSYEDAVRAALDLGLAADEWSTFASVLDEVSSEIGSRRVGQSPHSMIEEGPPSWLLSLSISLIGDEQGPGESFVAASILL